MPPGPDLFSSPPQAAWVQPGLQSAFGRGQCGSPEEGAKVPRAAWGPAGSTAVTASTCGWRQTGKTQSPRGQQGRDAEVVAVAAPGDSSHGQAGRWVCR